MNEFYQEDKYFSPTMIDFFTEHDYDTTTLVFDEDMFSVGVEILN